MVSDKSKFTKFLKDVSDIPLPKKFTFPFYYSVHPLAHIAAEELQHHIETQQEWEHDFGDEEDDESLSYGKMFGVLVVKNKEGELGYLSAFSGKLANANHHAKFVPPVFDMLVDGDFFNNGMDELREMQHTIRALEAVPDYIEKRATYKRYYQQRIDDIRTQKEVIRVDKKARKQIRTAAIKELSSEEYAKLQEAQAEESKQGRIVLFHIKKDWDEKIEKALEELNVYQIEIDEWKEKRAKFSANLQQRLFDNYTFLNGNGEEKSLNTIFQEKKPIGGAGECAAPKLLQYAFIHQMEPIALAEFWWGKSPRSAIRVHKQFYHACKGKCGPILGHMLQGLDVDDNPMLDYPGAANDVKIVYEDDAIIVVNKPKDLLSVPGIALKDSVATRMAELYPASKDHLIIHRLDMSTSGILILAKTKDAHKKMQSQFMNRTIKKRYVALLDGIVKENRGEIDLPLRVDLDDRPKQLVCYEHGKSAKTIWEVVEIKKGKTKVYFYPITGRTHQLRVHAAHPLGLKTPIVGDDLYGKKGSRLHLHAESIEFTHPSSGEKMRIQVDCEDF